jgi:hypothetical protein
VRLVTHFGLIKPPCLPSPEAIGARFGKVLAEGFGGTSRWNMFLPALIRVFSAHLTVIPTGIPIIGAVASTFYLGMLHRHELAVARPAQARGGDQEDVAS